MMQQVVPEKDIRFIAGFEDMIEIGDYLFVHAGIHPEKPLEVLRTVHSFDPCIACAIHMFDNEQSEIVRVKAL